MITYDSNFNHITVAIKNAAQVCGLNVVRDVVNEYGIHLLLHYISP